jgi:hypothetical protein
LFKNKSATRAKTAAKAAALLPNQIDLNIKRKSGGVITNVAPAQLLVAAEYYCPDEQQEDSLYNTTHPLQQAPHNLSQEPICPHKPATFISAGAPLALLEMRKSATILLP